MKEFVRSDDYMTRIFLDALDRDVHLDAEVKIIWSAVHRKLKAFCPKVNAFLQFPNNLRQEGNVFICDIIKAQTPGKIFYRVYKGSIRWSDGTPVM